MTWSHSGPLFPQNFLYIHNYLGRFEGGGRSPRVRFPKLHVEPFKQFEDSRTFTKFIEPLLPKKRTEKPCIRCGVYTVFLAGKSPIIRVIYGANIRFWPALRPTHTHAHTQPQTHPARQPHRKTWCSATCKKTTCS